MYKYKYIYLPVEREGCRKASHFLATSISIYLKSKMRFLLKHAEACTILTVVLNESAYYCT